MFVECTDVHTSFCNHLDVEVRAGCCFLFVFLVSRVCCVALPLSAVGLSEFVIVGFLTILTISECIG